jgi:hypothetical protein
MNWKLTVIAGVTLILASRGIELAYGEEVPTRWPGRR